jgi:hypothetical protein
VTNEDEEEKEEEDRETTRMKMIEGNQNRGHYFPTI